MRGKTFTFECAEHQEFGMNGWRMLGAPNADPLPGMAVAHDCMEHFPDGDMGVEDELMALGASIHVREFTRNMHSLGANCGSDLRDVLAHVWYEGMSLRDPGRTLPIDCEDELDDALKALTDEAKYDEDLEKRLTPEIKRFIRGWMRRGYRAAVRRWHGVQTRSIFDEIEREADRLLKHAELGTKLFVRLNFARGIVTNQRRVSVRVWDREVWEEEEY